MREGRLLLWRLLGIEFLFLGLVSIVSEGVVLEGALGFEVARMLMLGLSQSKLKFVAAPHSVVDSVHVTGQFVKHPLLLLGQLFVDSRGTWNSGDL